MEFVITEMSMCLKEKKSFQTGVSSVHQKQGHIVTTDRRDQGNSLKCLCKDLASVYEGFSLLSVRSISV